MDAEGPPRDGNELTEENCWEQGQVVRTDRRDWWEARTCHQNWPKRLEEQGHVSYPWKTFQTDADDGDDNHGDDDFSDTKLVIWIVFFWDMHLNPAVATHTSSHACCNQASQEPPPASRDAVEGRRWWEVLGWWAQISPNNLPQITYPKSSQIYPRSSQIL